MASECDHEVVPMEDMPEGMLKSDSVDSAGIRLGADNRTNHFTLSVVELRELMEYRGHEAVERIRDHYGTIRNICDKLFTSENDGL